MTTSSRLAQQVRLAASDTDFAEVNTALQEDHATTLAYQAEQVQQQHVQEA